MKNIKLLYALVCAAVMLVIMSVSVSAATYGDLYYEVSNEEVIITDCNWYASGALTIPSEIDGYPVTSIDEYAFYDCTRLTSVSIPGSVTIIGKGAFSGCTSLTSVSIPDSVTSIADYTFIDCTSLTSVVIPDSVTSIGERAFYNCDILTSVSIPDSVTSIGRSAFANCTSLTSVRIPDSVTRIADYAFFCCTSLASVSIPDSVTSIGGRAFADCTSLASVSIPDSVTSIDWYAFHNTALYNNADNWESGVLYINNRLIDANDNISGEYILRDGTILIADYAFEDCTSLTSVIIPDSVTSIGAYAFYDCTSLTSVRIPVGITSIGYMTFYNCNSLTDVYYAGTESEWNNISIGVYNDPIRNATIHYNTTPVTSVSLDKSVITLEIGDTLGLTATVAPAQATNKAVNWASSDENIATVSADGVVTAKAVGSATITVTTADGGKSASCTVNVSVKSASYTVSYNANGGTNAPSAQTKIGGTELKLSPDVPTRDGYTFGGWTTDLSTATAEYATGAAFNRDADTTLYAVWALGIPTYVIGDTDGDGLLTVLDAIVLARHIARWVGYETLPFVR